MDSYLKKINNLRTEDRQASASRSRSSTPQPGPRKPVDGPHEIKPEPKRACTPRKKVAYKNDVDELKKCVEEAKLMAVAVKSQIENLKNEIMSKMDEHQKSLESKQENDSRYEKLKEKIDNFISSVYNENEIAHSELIKKIEDRINKIEDAF